METYQWLKVVHIVAFTSWMAMLFYIPRLFVYHAEHMQNSGFIQVVKIQEAKLYYCIGLPAMVVTILSGVGLIWVMGGAEYMRTTAWIHLKITLVALLGVYHLACGLFLRAFSKGTCKRSGRFFRVFNEIPTLILIVIVYLVIFQPTLWMA